MEVKDVIKSYWWTNFNEDLYKEYLRRKVIREENENLIRSKSNKDNSNHVILKN